MNEPKNVVGDGIVLPIRPLASGVVRVSVDWVDVPSEAIKSLYELQGAHVKQLLTTSEVTPLKIGAVEEFTIEESKSKQGSPSQRLRGAYWHLYQVHPEGFKDAESHYRYYMDKKIAEVGEAIDFHKNGIEHLK